MSMMTDSKLIQFSSLHTLAEMHVSDRHDKEYDRNDDVD
jgi:hypothetical protein